VYNVYIHYHSGLFQTHSANSTRYLIKTTVKERKNTSLKRCMGHISRILYTGFYQVSYRINTVIRLKNLINFDFLTMK